MCAWCLAGPVRWARRKAYLLPRHTARNPVRDQRDLRNRRHAAGHRRIQGVEPAANATVHDGSGSTRSVRDAFDGRPTAPRLRWQSANPQQWDRSTIRVYRTHHDSRTGLRISEASCCIAEGAAFFRIFMEDHWYFSPKMDRAMSTGSRREASRLRKTTPCRPWLSMEY